MSFAKRQVYYYILAFFRIFRIMDDIRKQLYEFNKLIGKKYQRVKNEPYKISSFYVSNIDQRIYVIIHPTRPNKRMLNVTKEANSFFEKYFPVEDEVKNRD